MLTVVSSEKKTLYLYRQRRIKALLGCGVLGSLMFVVVFLLDGATRMGYDPVYHPVSALSLGDRGWVQITNFVTVGLLMVAFAFGLRRVLHPGHGSTWGPLMFGAFGFSLLFSGIFPMDPMQGYPPGAPSGIYSDVSWQHILHDVFGIVVFVSLPIACFVFTRKFAEKPVKRGWMIYSAITGLAMSVLFVIFGMAWENDSPYGGLIQRIMLIVGLGWITLIAGNLYRGIANNLKNPTLR